jgi:CHAT domain-containing protein
VALVLLPGERTVKVVDLGPALPIEELVSEWRRETTNDPRLSPGGGSVAVRRYREIGDALRAALWDPVDERLGDRERVLVVPDGVLHLVNLSALPTDDGRYLIESAPPLHYLSTERDILLALGGPDFDVAVIAPPTDRTADPAQDIVYRSSLRGCENIHALRPLPGAEKEIRTLERLWNKHRKAGDRSLGKARALTGARATEAAFKRLSPGYRVTHLATHGFLLSGSCQSAGTSPVENDPLLLSGLALAGANNASDTHDTDREDGMLTAEEIASLDLAGVEWVVLSGCETGLGELHSSEGILGLRRSFEIAGVGSLISSLWAVDDDATRLWMEHLYRARHSGLSTAESVRRASLAMLNDARARGKSTHPFTWGAFLGVGDWR